MLCDISCSHLQSHPRFVDNVGSPANYTNVAIYRGGGYCYSNQIFQLYKIIKFCNYINKYFRLTISHASRPIHHQKSAMFAELCCCSDHYITRYMYLKYAEFAKIRYFLFRIIIKIYLELLQTFIKWQC